MEAQNNQAEKKGQRFYVFDETIIEPDEYLFRINEVYFCPTNNISTIKAQAKNGKSFLTSIFATACISGNWEGVVCANGKFQVVYIDTEQSRSKTAQIRQRIKTMCGEAYNSELLKMVNINGVDNPMEEFEAIVKENPDAKLFLLDGIVDIIPNFNDPNDCEEKLQHIRRIALENKCHIINVIHENPSSDKARGHLGTRLTQRGTETIQIKKNSDIDKQNPWFEVSFVEYRDKWPSDISFTIEEVNGIAIPVKFNSTEVKERIKQEKAEQTAKEKRNELYRMFEGAFHEKEFLCHKEVKNWLVNKHQMNPNSTSRPISNAVNEHILYQNEEGRYYLNIDFKIQT